MKKWIVVAIAAIVGIAAAAGGYLVARRYVTPPIIGELKVLSFAPQGQDVPISADGITVMFNRAVVPLTTLDRGRGKSVPITITPSVSGRFFWLGTHGFIFRPDEPLVPATKYKVEMPAGLVSVEGYRLDQPLAWEFSTVAPRIRTWEPADQQTLLSKDATVFLRFNIAMDQGDVESKLAIVSAENNLPLEARPDFIWGDDGHTLQIRFRDRLPWGASFKMTLPKGVRAARGDVGTQEETSVGYATSPREFQVEKVSASASDNFGSDERKTILAGKKAVLGAGSGICFAFTQPIEKKSFERAFHVELASEKSAKEKKPQPYFYFEEQESFPTVGEKGRTKHLEGYRSGCAAFLDEPGRTYEFSIDPAKIAALSGAKLTTGAEKYLVATKHANPEVHSLLTKNILSLMGPLTIPYRGINLASATVRLYKWSDTSEYSESIKNARIDIADLKAAAPMSVPLGEERVHVPVDPATMTIDNQRMPAQASVDVPLEMPRDRSTRFVVDLAELPERPGPGIYLVEVIGNPAAEAREGAKSSAVYSMIQISPVAIAFKRDVDRVIAWVTEIESGAPAAGRAVKVHAQRWSEEKDRMVTAGEKEGITDAQGIAVIPLSTEPDARLCVEVVTPGSESYACEEQHQISDTPSTLQPGPHYYAFITTDRPIYRPGQKVFFSSFVRLVREGRYLMPPSGTKVAVTATDAAGQKIFEQPEAAVGPGGVVSASFDLPDGEAAPRGSYTIEFKIDKQNMSRAFVVSSYRKPSFKVELTAAKPEIVSKQELDVEVAGSYFFGAPLKKAEARWSIMTSTYLFAPEGFESYSFIDEDLLHAKQGGLEGEVEYQSDFEYDMLASSYEITTSEDQPQYDDPRNSGGSGGWSGYGSDFFRDPEKRDTSMVPARLDDEGRMAIRYTPDLAKYPTSQDLSVEASLTDPSQQEVSGDADVIVHKAEFYLGVKPEKWVYGAKEKATIQVVSLDTAGKPASGTSFALDVVRREYKFIERRNARGYWELIFEPQDTKLATLDKTTDGNGVASLSYNLPQGGEFRFVARAKDGKGNETQSATTVFAWGEGYVPWRLDKPEKIELVADKDSYKQGDTAKILVKSLVPVTQALLTLERGRVLEERVIDLGGNATHLEIPITEGMIPNIYVSLVAHVGRSADHPPLLYSGQVMLRVEPGRKRLDVAIETDRKGEKDGPPVYRPGDEVQVRLRTTDSAGTPRRAHVIVSVADESVLRLLNYQLPDLVKKFYYVRPDSVVTASSLLSLKAGDAGQGAGKRRRVFKDTAFFAADITTDEKGEASFSFKLPDDVTTWVIEALGITESASLKAFDEELTNDVPAAPAGQRAVAANLMLTDNTFVGGSRAKVMATLPLVLRAALPRFAAWGDALEARVIANNRTTAPVEGVMTIAVSGDGLLEGEKASEQVKLSVPAGAEQTIPVSIEARAAGRITLTADAKGAGGEQLDALENSIPVLDRFAPEVVVTAGTTQTTAAESIDLPKGTLESRGGLDVSLRASLALAAAPSLRMLVYFPWGCSEQKSATLMALLMAREMTGRFGEAYFDALAPFEPEKIKELKGLSEKKALLDDRIESISKELVSKFQHYDGGMRYWPESNGTDLFASIQTLAAFTMARAQAIVADEEARTKLAAFVRKKIGARDKEGRPVLGADLRAYGLWALTLDGTREPIAVGEWQSKLSDLSVSGLSYLLMAMKQAGAAADLAPIKGQLLALAKQEPRSTSWPASGFFWSSSAKNTALAGLALLTVDPSEPAIPRSLDFLLNRKKAAPCACTQDNLSVSLFTTAYAREMKEEATDFTATVAVGKEELLKKSFEKDNLLSEQKAELPMKKLADLSMPAAIAIEKKGEGTLYYDMMLKYYLPPDKAPTREEGIIISREYYALDDVKEEKPLREFKAGENYKGHITIALPQEMNYIVVQDLLSAGFEPIDMTLATSSRAAGVAARGEGEIFRNQWDETPDYDDVVPEIDYGMDFGFRHQEVRDDAIVWSDERVPAGVYHIRYPVRATTAGTFLMPGAQAFEFYRPEIFGRSLSRVIEIR